MTYTIYKITNQINKKFYIGFTTATPPEKRWGAHIRLAASGLHKNLHFHNAIRKYGPSAFVFEILKQGNDSEWGRKVEEPFHISMYLPEYNKTFGGEGIQGLIRTEEHKRKIGDALRGLKRPPMGTEHRTAISQGTKGRTFSEIHKKRLSEAKFKYWEHHS